MNSDNSALSTLKNEIEQFCAEMLDSYVESLEVIQKTSGGKEFSDPVWSTIFLTHFEIIIVDSPLFQRLRYIKQLGVIHWVYPGAIHTRFEHSLGVLNQVQTLVDSINRSCGKNHDNQIPAEWTCTLRLAALCHDLGHGLMSHVSEKALDAYLSVESAKFEFVDEQDHLEKIPFAELIAYLMMGTKAFRKLVTKAKEISNEVNLLPEGLERSRDAVIGKTIYPKIPLLQELVTGPFDGDKLDYMARDALFSGVPAVTDVARLVRKIRAVSLPPNELPPELAKNIVGGLPYYTVFGLAISGARTLDELMLGRILLFDKLYRHHKVRAAEGMVENLFSHLVRIAKISESMLALRLTDDEALSGRILEDVSIFLEKTEENSLDFDMAYDLAKCLKNRDLFVRSFAFAQHIASDPYNDHPQQQMAAEKLIRDLRSDRKVSFLKSIEKEIFAIIDCLADPDLIRIYKNKPLLSYLVVDPPEASASASKINQAYLIESDNSVRRFRDTSVEVRTWSDAYLFAKDVGYIFCPRNLKILCNIAAEKVCRTTYGFRSPVSLRSQVKILCHEVDELKRNLASKGYYNGLARDLIPIPVRLTKLDIPRRLSAIIRNLSGYVGPFINSAKNRVGPYLTERHLTDWICQFHPDFIELAIQSLEKIEIIGREVFVATLRSFAEEHPKFKDSWVVPLGDIKDSGPTIAYFAGDVFEDSVREVSAALLSDEVKPIIFVDDFIGSGSQAVSIVEDLLGIEKSVELKEGKRRRLNQDEEERLRSVPIAFVYGGGWSTGSTKLKTRSKELGLDIEVKIGVSDGQLPSLYNIPIEDEAMRIRFIAECSRIGLNLLTFAGVEEAKIQNRTLGYGGRALLVTFQGNTPSQALTALWAQGEIDDFIWEPLFPRRKKR
jgi:HD superfamily phosphohydrolase